MRNSIATTHLVQQLAYDACDLGDETRHDRHLYPMSRHTTQKTVYEAAAASCLLWSIEPGTKKPSGGAVNLRSAALVARALCWASTRTACFRAASSRLHDLRRTLS